MGWGWGYGPGYAGGLPGFLLQIAGVALFALLIAGVVLLVIRLARPLPDAGAARGQSRALEIVDERLARGEISEEEHARLRAALRGP